MSDSIIMFHSSSDLYGSGKIFQKTAVQFQEMGFRPIVVLSGDGPMVEELRSREIDVRFVNLAILRRKYFTPLGVFNRAFMLMAAYRRLSQIIKTEDVKLIYTQSSGAIVAALLKWRTGLPHIWHVLEITLRPRVLVWFTSFLLDRFADTVVVASGEVKRQWTRVRSTKMQVIYNGVDTEPFQSEAIAVRDNEHKESVAKYPGKVCIGMIGRVHWWKGQDYFLNIAAELLKDGMDVKFLMAGDAYPGYEYLYDELKTKRTELNIEHAVLDLGYVEDATKFFELIDVFVLPSVLPDPFPTTVLEAMASHLPVVATAHGGALEMVEDGVTGYLVPWDDPAKAADIIKTLVASEELRRDLGQQGFKRLISKFHKDNYVREMGDLAKKYLTH